jgi:23S rRNA (pseudouridine1915-N3)-methyltransferase
MKIKLVCIGKTGKSFLEDGEKEYTNRLSHYVKFEKIEIPDIKNAKSLSKDQILEKEGELILDKCSNAEIILLDERGKQFSSVDFSNFLQEKFNYSSKDIAFVIGGPYGFSPKVYEASSRKISLSKMTFSHQMIRLFFIEQIYRSMTILKGEPYHHE